MIIKLPASLEPRRQEILAVITKKIIQFTEKCLDWHTSNRCHQALNRVSQVIVVDHFRFPLAGTPRGVANGQWMNNGRRIKVCLYNINYDVDSGVHTRTRDQMVAMALGKAGKAYWASLGWEIFSADTSDLLPGLVHEF